MGTATVVVFKTGTREVLAAVPIGAGLAICQNDVDFQVFKGTEPVFCETPNGIILAKNKFIINPWRKDDEE